MRTPQSSASRSRPSAGPSRRELLCRTGGGFAGLALAGLLGQEELLANRARPGVVYAGDGLHHPARAKRVIQLFMNGGASQCDTFDYKPELARRHGQKFDPGVRVEASTSSPGSIMKSPFAFRQHGECGRWVSSVFPHTAAHVDDMAFLMSITVPTNVHGLGSYIMNTGFTLPGFPCLGSWISYGLGSLSDNLPSFVVLPDNRGLPYNNTGDFSAGFLPASNASTIIRPGAPEPIADLFPPKDAKFISKESEADGLKLLNELNRDHAGQCDADSRLEARIASYELAAKMQLAAPGVLDISQESAGTRAMYGLDDPVTQDFGHRCLVGRRLLEQGVRFVQVWSGAGGSQNNWDNHGSIPNELTPVAATIDKPIAALLSDLGQRGMLEDTLVVWTTEFGRMPFSQATDGRDHNGGTFVSWFAGAGVRRGVAHGESDEWSWRARVPITCYDMHATILHLLGIDHKRLTFRNNGIDRRITDVHGEVISPILA